MVLKTAISAKRRAFTWSPSAGTSPEPSRRSRAFTPPEPGISANLGAAAEAGAVRRAEAVAPATRRCLLVRVGGGVAAEVTAFPFGGGGTAPATAVTAVVTIAGCSPLFFFFLCFMIQFDFFLLPNL